MYFTWCIIIDLPVIHLAHWEGWPAWLYFVLSSSRRVKVCLWKLFWKFAVKCEWLGYLVALCPLKENYTNLQRPQRAATDKKRKNKEQSMVRGGRWWLSICPAAPLSRGCYWMWLFLSHHTPWLPAFSKSIFGDRGKKRQLLFIPFFLKKSH